MPAHDTCMRYAQVRFGIIPHGGELGVGVGGGGGGGDHCVLLEQLAEGCHAP